MDIGAAGWLVNKRTRATTANDPVPEVGMGGCRLILELPRDGYQHQKHINMCGEACVVMLYKYHGADAGIDMSRNPRGAFKGGTQDKLMDTYTKLSLTTREADSFRPKVLRDILAKYGPVIVSGDFARMMGTRWGHFILVHGISEDMVFIADPWHGEDRRKSFDWFTSKLGEWEYGEKGNYTNMYHFLWYNRNKT